LKGLPGDPVTSNGGVYTATVPYGWTGIVTPTLAGYRFTPSTFSYEDVSDDLVDQNFTFTRSGSDDCVQWLLDDNSDNDLVSGNEIHGQIFDGDRNRTSSLAAVVNGKRAFHFNGINQYVRISIPNVWPSGVEGLWTKYSGNPVIYSTSNITYGQVVKNPEGGYYFFGCTPTIRDGDSCIYRWSSNDMFRWRDRTLMLPSGGPGAWDKQCQVSSAICKPDGTWAMLYRGYDGQHYRIGKAVSDDGTNWFRVGNGPSTQFGDNFDPVGIMLAGDTYYIWTNGEGGHGVEYLYTSKDFETFTRYGQKPIFNPGVPPGEFCASPWYYNGFYYLLVTQDFSNATSDLYDHAFALYRSPVPTFDPNKRDFLGYPIVNDKPYDARYMDTPSVPVMDVSRTYSNEFGNNLYCIYNGTGTYPGPYSINTQNLAYTTLDKLVDIKPKLKNLYEGRITYSFWMQFDNLSQNKVLFSAGSSPSDVSPVWLCKVRSKGTNLVLSLYLNGTYQLGNTPLINGTPYHIVIVDDADTIKLYVNGVYDGLQSAQHNTAVDSTYLYIGTGYNDSYFSGYIWDFRIYHQPLTNSEINSLYRTNSIVVSNNN
jgi:hypothetical protein